jgi:hypothetical protein
MPTLYHGMGDVSFAGMIKICCEETPGKQKKTAPAPVMMYSFTCVYVICFRMFRDRKNIIEMKAFSYYSKYRIMIHRKVFIKEKEGIK